MRAETMVGAEPEAVYNLLADGAAVAEWNPAITSITPPDRPVTTGREYHTVIRGVIRARLRFSLVSPTLIRYQLSALGSVETGSWRLTPVDGGTYVSHDFEHSGAVLGLMRGAFQGVAALRVGRLRRMLVS
jgi:uncharacterized protein YndB with AHSA1/START domain